MSFLKKIEGPLALCSGLIILFLVEYFFNVPIGVSNVTKTLQVWVVTIACFATFLGTIGLTITHISRIRRRFKNVWPYSILLIVVMFLQIAIGVILGATSDTYMWIFTTVYRPLHISAFSIQGFFYLLLAYTAFRARSIESGMFAIGVIFVALRNSPMTGAMWIGFDVIGNWIQTVISTGASRGIHIVAGVGMVLVLIRMVFWIERHHVSGVG